MCYIDSEMENKGYRYARYVDDISFSFNFEEEKDKFLQDFNKLCMKYELKINDKKTEVNDFLIYIHKTKTLYLITSKIILQIVKMKLGL